jgi:SAM-dependent MidA family methyltransferase
MTDTPLALKLKARIRSGGPISLRDYVDACLNDPEHGYYRRRPAVGAEGDFVTAPEISQVFGELIGLWCAVVWQQMGSPPALDLVELGPGRGTLMRDALRAARIVPGFREALTVRLVDSNDTLVAQQRAALADSGALVHWHASPSECAATLAAGAAPFLVVANEFLDTCPAEQYIVSGGRLIPRGVGLDANGALAFTTMPDGAQPAEASLVDGASIERQDFSIMAPLLALMQTRRAAALFIDYGAPTGGSDTLQAVRDHRFEPALRSPGEADLSFQVDFGAFAAAALAHPGLAADGPAPQGEFLGRLGVVERASRLMARNPEKAGAIELAVQRLMAPSAMGSRFLALGVRSLTLAPLPGLA